ncbi:hypothetical protein RS130_12010 [Paraglaciecola aquimarina]|uniref:Uncharacterized protein n=1 Tax=Paraglaciecola aquimarina TaxID=1235557 RepID=A0ABU3SX25_9ALTE|nr:hypothetical protein [Paraglaciecola aquimarina]MDU0354561.1 hypothetical protein [Paraglaciecola aquimarina]
MINKSNKQTGVYQSPLSKLFLRQQPKVRAKKGMANLLMAYADDDVQKIAQVIRAWLEAD